MKITVIKSAHLIEVTGIQDVSSNAHPPYWRIQDGDNLYWLTNVHTIDDHKLVYSKRLVRELEEEFRAMYGVMHEQLELF